MNGVRGFFLLIQIGFSRAVVSTSRRVLSHGESSAFGVVASFLASLLLILFVGLSVFGKGGESDSSVPGLNRKAAPVQVDSEVQNGSEFFRDGIAQRLADASGSGRLEDPLERICFMAGNRYVTLKDAEREAREVLNKEKLVPPVDLKATFEVEDKPVFLTVKFLQGVGERYWAVRFNREFQVDSIESHILRD